MWVEIKRTLANDASPMWICKDSIVYVDPETTTICLTTGKVFNTTKEEVERIIEILDAPFGISF